MCELDPLLCDMDLLVAELRDAGAVAGADEIAAKGFRLTQNASSHWRGSNTEVRRDLLDVLCLNRKIDESTLTWDWRYPFDVLVCCANRKVGRGGRI